MGRSKILSHRHVLIRTERLGPSNALSIHEETVATNCTDLLALPFIIFFTSKFKSDTRPVAWIDPFLHQCVLVASV